MGYVLITTQELKHRAEEVARRLGQVKYEADSFNGTPKAIEGWLVGGLPPVKDGFKVCQLVLSTTGRLYLRHMTTPPKREDAKSVIDEVPFERAADLTKQSLQTLFSRVDHLMTDAGLRN